MIELEKDKASELTCIKIEIAKKVLLHTCYAASCKISTSHAFHSERSKKRIIIVALTQLM